MDPFLPGEIPLMVLRYLAANKCETAALALIEEMPLLKGHINPKPPHVSNSDYMKYLGRSSVSVNVGLKDVLTDYGNSKILVEEILENENTILPNVPSDSLLNKVKTLQDLMKKPTTSSVNTSRVANSPKNLSSTAVKVDGFTNTEEFYECPRCLVNQSNQKVRTDSTSQTEEAKVVQFGLQDEIPVIFCRTLLNDDDLQQKIAQTINEHLEDPQGAGNDVVQKISSKTENEIDKFLVDLLQGIKDDGNEAEGDVSIQILDTNRISTYAEVDSNLSAIFGEDEMLFGTEAAGSNSQPSAERGTKKLLPSTSADHDSSIKDVTSDTPSMSVTASSSCTSPNTEPGSSSSCDSNKPQSSSSDLKTPKQHRRGSSVKRITPTPLTSANINPVFNTSVVIEKQSVDVREKSAECSVVTVNSDIPPWQKLKRKPIAPKIPGMGPPIITENFTVVRTEGRKPYYPKPLSVTNDSESDRREKSRERTKEPVSIQATSSKKRKTHPSKLTPEKAKNTCAMKTKTPLPSSSTVEIEPNVKPSDENDGMPLINENSQNDVTPMQPPPPRELGSSSDLKTISPCALHRLIASANKLCSTTAPIHFHKRKSYSTPRKRKHVRSLSFATPPSLKAVTPHSGPANDASKKRKADDEWYAAELKSKKRLNWPESEKKKALSVVVPPLRSSERPVSGKQESTITKDHTTAAEEGLKESLNSEDTVSKKSNMSTILEESVVEPPQSITYVTLPSSHIDSSLPFHYVQLGDDTQSLYPIHFTSFTHGPSGMNPASTAAPFTVVQSLSEPNPAFQTMSFHAQSSNQLLPLVSSQAPELPSEHYNAQSIPPHIQTAAPHPVQASKPQSTISSKPYTPSIFSPVQPTEPRQPSRHIIPPVSSLASHPQNPSGQAPTTEQPPLVQNITPEMPQPNPSVNKQTHSDTQKSSDPKKPGRRKSRNRSAELPVPNDGETVPPLPPSQSDSTKRVLNPSEVSTNNNELDSQANPDSTRRSRRRCKSGDMNTTLSENTSPSCLVEQETSRRTRKSARISEIKKQPESKATVEKPARVSSGSRSSRSKSQNIDSSTVEQKDTQELEVHKKDGNKKEKGKEKSKGAQKKAKPKLTMNVLELFGDSPCRKKSAKSSNRRSPDAVAAQMVAAEAVPLGSPRRSPRKHRMIKKQREEDSPFHKQLSYFGSLPSNENTENSCKSLSVLPPQENTVFNIVPAPLGFPEPTPIKNFLETGFLNISNIGFNSPLITPLKSNPPPSLNDTHFTLPPTPRAVVDQDSNSNSTHSLRLIFDGLYPANLLTSTPLKFGLPKTPGRESSSSNSRSPPSKTEGDLPPSHGESAQPPLNPPSPVEPPQRPLLPHSRVEIPQRPLHPPRLVEHLPRPLLPPSQVEIPKRAPPPLSQMEPPQRPPPPPSRMELPQHPQLPKSQMEPAQNPQLPQSQVEPPRRPPPPPLGQVEPPQRPPLSPPYNQQQKTANDLATKGVIANNTALDLSSPRNVEKSDGELSSSDDDDDKAKTDSTKLTSRSRKQVQKVIPLQPPPPTGTPPPHRSSNMIPRSYSSTTQVVHPVQKQHQRSISHSQSIPGIPHISQMDGLGRFRVAGKEKILTFSEHETLVCLVEMRNTGKPPEIIKENAPTVHQPAAVADLPKAGAEVSEVSGTACYKYYLIFFRSFVENNTTISVTLQENHPFKILQHRKLVDLLKLVKKKHNPDSQK
ncbi:unnamed protein product [Orchesella dallaii]|uniref:LisH domain-containing protein n=1 Tax=Orchesella dallaii TaxID=48710 RepID=A0ABP1PM28_9HEXA